MIPVAPLTATRASAATALLCSAFAAYPVMRYVLGPAGDYATRLRTLIGFFVTARLFRQDLILGASSPTGQLVGVALVTLPGDRPPPEALADRREAVWRDLGLAARARYEAFGTASHQFDIREPHHHLNMIGLDPAAVGQGYARSLLDHVHQVAAADAQSVGVTLTTELPQNCPLYRHFGYRELGHARVAPDLETWAFIRPTPRPAGR